MAKHVLSIGEDPSQGSYESGEYPLLLFALDYGNYQLADALINAGAGLRKNSVIKHARHVLQNADTRRQVGLEEAILADLSEPNLSRLQKFLQGTDDDEVDFGDANFNKFEGAQGARWIFFFMKQSGWIREHFGW